MNFSSHGAAVCGVAWEHNLTPHPVLSQQQSQVALWLGRELHEVIPAKPQRRMRSRKEIRLFDSHSARREVRRCLLSARLKEVIRQDPDDRLAPLSQVGPDIIRELWNRGALAAATPSVDLGLEL